MPTATPNYGLALYNSTTDQGVNFLDYRLAISGPAASNMTKIDTALGELAATRGLMTVPAVYTSPNYYEANGVTEFSAYQAKMTIAIKLDVTNAGYVTLNINNAGTKHLKKVDDAGSYAALDAGDLKINKEYIFRYDGAQWVWVQQQMPVPDGAVTTVKLADNSVTTAKIVDLNVTTGKINNDAVTSSKIADLNVTTAKINDLAVTNGKLADLTITGAKITPATITADKLVTPLGIAWEKLAELVLTSDSVVDFANISQSFRHLKIVYCAKRAASDSWTSPNLLRFNEDTSSAYTICQVNFRNTDNTWQYATSVQAWAYGGYARFYNTNVTDSAGWSQGEISLDHYRSDKYKYGRVEYTSYDDSDHKLGKINFFWANANAINRIQISTLVSPSSTWGGLFRTGSIFSLYGLP